MASNIITPSDTPLKRYHVKCPSCNEESVVLPAGEPDKPYCPDCDEEIDLDDLTEFITSWQQYLADRAALLAHEAQAKE